MTKKTQPQEESSIGSDTANSDNIATAETPTDVAEIEGDKIVGVIDYTDILKIQEDKLRITDKEGKSAGGSLWKLDPVTKERYLKAFPEWHYAWVRNGKDGGRNQIGQRLMEKYIIVTPQTDPDLVVPALSDSVKKNGRYELHELTLMKLPMDYKIQRDAYFKKKNDDQMADIKRDLENKDAYGEINIQQRGG